MDINLVKYQDSRAYIKRYISNKKGAYPKVRKYFGQVVRCDVCKTLYFLPDSTIRHNNLRHCSRRCHSLGLRNMFTGKDNPTWKGGRFKHSYGYILVHLLTHPFPAKGHYVYEHRLIMEKYLGRYLTRKEVVHHKNGIVNDNRIENLRLFPNQSAHASYHKEVEK